MKIIFFIGLLIAAANCISAQDCNLSHYRTLMGEAEKAAQKGNYELAINKLQSAKVCQPDSEAVVNRRVVEVFREVNRQRELAISATKEARRERDAAEKARQAEEAARKQAELEAQANASVTQALKIAPTDPTAAFGFAQKALELTPLNLSAAEVRANILQDNYLYGKLLTGHEGWVRQLLFAPGDSVMFSAAADGRVMAWNTTTWQPETWRDHGNTDICALEISNEARALLYVFTDGFAVLRSLDSMKMQTKLATGFDKLRCAAFVPFQKQLLLGCSDGWLRFWSWESRSVVDSLSIGKRKLQNVAFLPSKGMLAVATEGEVQLWDLGKKEITAAIKTPEYFISGVTVAPDQESVYVNNGPVVTQFDLGGSQLLAFGKHPSAVSSNVITPDGKLMVVGTLDGATYLWGASGSYLSALMSTPHLQSQFSGIFTVAYNANAAVVATSGGDRAIRIWHLNKAEIAGFSADKFEVSGIGFCPDRERVATAGMTGSIRLWDVAGGERCQLHVFSKGIFSAEADSRGTMFCLGSSDSVALVALAADTFSLVRKWKAQERGPVTRARWLPTGQEIVTASSDGWVKVWNLLGQEQARYFIAGTIHDVASSSDGQIIAVAAADSNAYLIERSTGKLTALKHKAPVMTLDFKPNTHLLSSGSSNVIRIWDADRPSAEPLRFSVPNAAIWTLRYAPNGNHFAVGCWNRTARIFDRFGQEIQVVQGHSGVVRSLRFSEDGNYLFSGDNQGNVRVSLTLDAMLQKGRIFRPN